MTTRISLPWPDPILSPNWRGHRMKRAAATKAYRKACADAAWNAGMNPVECEGFTLSAVTFYPPTDAGHDLDNLVARFKAGQDGLSDAMGVNDKSFRPIPSIGPKVKGGMVLVAITRAEIPA